MGGKDKTRDPSLDPTGRSAPDDQMSEDERLQAERKRQESDPEYLVGEDRTKGGTQHTTDTGQHEGEKVKSQQQESSNR